MIWRLAFNCLIDGVDLIAAIDVQTLVWIQGHQNAAHSGVDKLLVESFVVVEGVLTISRI